MEYRNLTEDEISQLEKQGCTAEDWAKVSVAAEFVPDYVHNVGFQGDICLGSFNSFTNVSASFKRHSGIYNALLNNVSVGNDCLIENIGHYISNYDIGNGCIICNTSLIETTDGATFGEGGTIAVLNEAGDGNVVATHSLTCQLAALCVRNSHDADFRNAVRRLANEENAMTQPSRGFVGDHAKITNTNEIINVAIQADCEISGAARITDCTIQSSASASAYVGTGVILENSIIGAGSSITDFVKLQDCFVGQACQITSSFTANQCLFFDNTFMSCGEACAAFCGPFTASHHKSTLLIGGMFSFYNAGSATNFSNHAYKMGPVHWGVLERGCKTASGSYIFMPAHIGYFSVVMGKVMSHPDTMRMPFSYIIASDDKLTLVPGRNLATVGLWRDVRKWPQRDLRPTEDRQDIINFDWLSPTIMQYVVEGRNALQALRQASVMAESYVYRNMVITASSLQKGIKLYNIAIQMFICQAMQEAQRAGIDLNSDAGETGQWTELCGLYLLKEDEKRLVNAVKDGSIESFQDLQWQLDAIHANYTFNKWAWARQLACEEYNVNEINEAIEGRITANGKQAMEQLTALVKKDAEKEFGMGDVDKQLLNSFLQQLEA